MGVSAVGRSAGSVSHAGRLEFPVRSRQAEEIRVMLAGRLVPAAGVRPLQSRRRGGDALVEVS